MSADSTDPEKYMRYSSIVVEESMGGSDNNKNNVWRVVQEGKFLPEGLWFVDKSMEVDADWMDAFQYLEYFQGRKFFQTW